MINVQIGGDSRYPLNRKRVRFLVEKTVTREGITSSLTVSIAVVGNRKMKDLNTKFHGRNTTTDVLSFPYLDPSSNRDQVKFVTPEDEGIILGDLVICYPQAVKQAGEKGKLVDEEIDFLVEHGMQHLLGHHHE